MTENDIAKEIVDAALRTHHPRLESVYDAVLAHELGHQAAKEA